MELKEVIIGTVISATVAVAGAGLTTWRATATLEQELHDTKREIEFLRQQGATTQTEIAKIYSIGGKLDMVVDELKQLRQDIRQSSK